MEYTTGWLELNDGVNDHAMNLSQLDYNTNQEITDDGSGTLYAETLSMTGFAPEASGTTAAIKQLLSNIGIGGTCILTGGSLEIADVISRRLDDCDTVLGATPHFQHRCTKGLILPVTLSADRNSDATLSFVLHTFTDSAGNAPVAETDGVAAPVAPDLVNERYRLGVCEIGGVTFDEIENVTINFNVTITPKEPGLAQVTPETAGVITIRPDILLRGRDLSKVKAGLIELGANTAIHTDTVFQLVQLKDASTFYLPAELKHIAITSYGVAVPSNLSTGSAGARATNEIRLAAGFDGTNAPLVPTYDVAYTPTP